MKNPFIPLDNDNPSCYSQLQKSLVGEGAEERSQLQKEQKGEWEGGKLSWIWIWIRLLTNHGLSKAKKESRRKFYKAFSDDVKKQRQRIGGDWVISDWALITRDTRDIVK